MAKLKITFSPLFIIFGFIMIFFGWAHKFFIYTVVLLLHESAHYVSASLFGYKLNKVIFMPYGAGLSGESNHFMPRHEIIIALAGPLFNIVLAFFCIVLWWTFPITYVYTELFVVSNLVLGIFNLIPIFPLDGGRILVAYLSEKTSKIKLYKAMRILGLTVSSVFIIMFFLTAFSTINLTYIFIACFLGISSINNISDVYYERSYLKIFNTKGAKIVEVKTYAVSASTPLLKLVKYIKGNNYTQFLVLDPINGRPIKIISETQVLKSLNSNNNKI